MLKSHLNEVNALNPAISLEEGTPSQMLSGEFCEILKIPILQNTSRQLILFYEKNISKVVKNSLRKWEKVETACKKNNHTGKTKINHFLHQVFISFYYSKMSLFLFSLLPMIHRKHQFLEQCNPIEDYLL